jgi:AraC family transcriptional activator of mtrCDE
MDTLSRLLNLFPVQASLDIRCQFGTPWRLDEPAISPGIAPYHLIVTGTAWLDAPNQKEIGLQAGDIIVFPHGAAHCLHAGAADEASPLRIAADAGVVPVKVNDGNGPAADILCGRFHFNAPGANALLHALPETILVRTADRPDFAGLQALIGMLRTETEAMRPGANAVVAQLSSVLFALLIRAWLEQARAAPGMLALLAEPRLQAALQGMLVEPAREWSVRELADTCHMSRASFARLFRQAAGATPAEALLQMRMAQAAHWLAQEGRTVGGIGEAVGYRSEAAFHRAFKRCYGIGPGGYRRQMRNSAIAGSN